MVIRCDKDAFSSCLGKVLELASASPHRGSVPSAASTGENGEWNLSEDISAVVALTSDWTVTEPSKSLRNLHVLAAGVGRTKGEDDESYFEPANPASEGLVWSI